MKHRSTEGIMTKPQRRIARAIALAAMVASVAACPLGRGSKELGETCERNTDCANAMCPDKVCSKSCKADADCAPAKVKMICKGNAKTESNKEGNGRCAVP